MESTLMPGLVPSKGRAPAAQITVPSPMPLTNAAEIGAFIIAQLTQVVPTSAPLGAPVEAPPAEVADTAADADLPLQGQEFTPIVQALPLALVSVLPALATAPVARGAGGALGMPRTGTAIAARPQANSFAPADARTAGAAETDPFKSLAPALRPANVGFSAGGSDITLEASFAARGSPETKALAPTPAATENPQLHTPARAAELLQAAQPYAGKSASLPLAQPEVFAERINQQLSVMISNNAHHARIAVNPPQLGPVEVRVSVVGDEVTVHLAASHAATREALEDALPRLRTAFTDSGMTLGESGVFNELPERSQAHAAQEGSDDGGSNGGDGESADALLPLRVVRLGLIDLYA